MISSAGTTCREIFHRQLLNSQLCESSIKCYLHLKAFFSHRLNRKRSGIYLIMVIYWYTHFYDKIMLPDIYLLIKTAFFEKGGNKRHFKILKILLLWLKSLVITQKYQEFQLCYQVFCKLMSVSHWHFSFRQYGLGVVITSLKIHSSKACARQNLNMFRVMD